MEVSKILGDLLSKLKDWQLFIVILLWIVYLFYNANRLDRPIRIIERELINSYEEIKKLIINYDKHICNLNSKIEKLVKSIKYDIIIDKLEKILTQKFVD